jgi:hypothetical protein
MTNLIRKRSNGKGYPAQITLYAMPNARMQHVLRQTRQGTRPLTDNFSCMPQNAIGRGYDFDDLLQLYHVFSAVPEVLARYGSSSVYFGG